MPRSPLVPVDSPKVSNESKNAVAQSRAFKAVIEQSFGGTILPSGVITFAKKEAPLYLTGRANKLDVSFTPVDSNYLHEEYLDLLFWDEASSQKLTFLVGGVGTGKSTFLDFYLRCYCPRISINRERYSSKLSIIVNAKTKLTSEDLVSWFYRQAANTIQARLNEHPDFVIPLPPSLNSYSSPEGWTWAVLQYITKCQRGDAATGFVPIQVPFKYIVIAIDDLDQCPPDVQQRAISMIRDWLDPKAELGVYRAYIPLWPHTLDRLLNDLGNPFAKNYYTTVQIGELPCKMVLQTRTSHASEKIQETAIPFAPVPADEPDGDVVVNGQIDNSSVRQFIIDTLDFSGQLASDFVEDFCHHDLRRELQIWENILSSRVAFRDWRNYKMTGQRPYAMNILPYDIVDAMLTGVTEVYNKDKSRISNIYNIGSTPSVIGLHMLWLLSNESSESLSKSAVFRTMRSVGYHEIDIVSAFDSLSDANMYHEVITLNNVGIRDIKLLLHKDSLASMWELAFHPAYLDNIAMVCPVVDRLKSVMRVTTSIIPEHFPNRVRTTLSFLAQVRADEEAWFAKAMVAVSSHLQSEKSGLSMVGKLSFPVVWRSAALRYEERLYALKKQGKPAGVSDKWVTEFLLEPSSIIAEARKMSEFWSL